MKIGTVPRQCCVMKSIHEAQGVGNFYRKALRHVNEFKRPSHDEQTINALMCLIDAAQSCDDKGISIVEERGCARKEKNLHASAIRRLP